MNLAPTDSIVTLLSNVKDYHRYVEIAIKQCRNGGIDCKVHGLQVVGKKRGDEEDEDAFSSSMSFLASDSEECDDQHAAAVLGSGSMSYSGSRIRLSASDGKQQRGDAQSTKVFVWGLNDKDQLGGLKGSKIKLPILSETLSNLKPVHISGGSKSLFVVTQEGKVYACGEGTNGRLGLGHSNNISSPRQVTALAQYVVKKVSVHSGGKHAMALTVDGRVFSWGEGDDGKLGHCSRMSCDKPRLIEALKSKRVRDIACGSSHSAAITSSGELFTWGCGEYGRLGHGDNVTQLRPKQVKALAGQRVVQVACGSRDAQTLALTDEGLVYSWGDGDFGKLGRGGSEGCALPQNVEKLNGAGILQIECGAQFSLALSKSGLVWTWGKGDYFRLGHGADQHVRKPSVVECLRGKKIVHVAVGALHCLAVTDAGQVYAWGDNDHGQQGNATTAVNRKPALVHGLEGSRISKVACGSSHSVAWTTLDTPSANCHEPVLFAASKDSLGAGFVSNCNVHSAEGNQPEVSGGGARRVDSNVCHTSPARHASGGGGAGSSGHSSGKKVVRPSLSRILLSLESNSAKQQALQHILNGLQILCAREAVVAALAPHGGSPSSLKKVSDRTGAAAGAANVASSTATPSGTLPKDVEPPSASVAAAAASAVPPLASPESDNSEALANEISESNSVDGFLGSRAGGGEAPAEIDEEGAVELSNSSASAASEEISPRSVECDDDEEEISSEGVNEPAGEDAKNGDENEIMIAAEEKPAATKRRRQSSRRSAKQSHQDHHRLDQKYQLDDFTRLLLQDDARLIVDLLKLAVAGRCRDRSRESLSNVLSALGVASPAVGEMLLELCVTELEDAATDTERFKSMPQPVVQESTHPYTGELPTYLEENTVQKQ